MRSALRWMGALGAMLVYFVIQPPTSYAGNQGRAGINLGLTSFFDGFGRPVEGFTYQTYLHYATANAFYDAYGNENKRFDDPKFDVFLWLNQLSYTLPHTVFGGRARPGINFILPLTGYKTSFGPGPNPAQPAPKLTDNGTGFGDLTFGPTLQFLPITVGGRPVFSHRFELDLIVPTGKYNPDKNINQSANYVSINPYWAFTVLPFAGFELTGRFNYIYNFTNERPVNPPRGGTPPMALPVESAQAGQTIWLNYATSYEIVKTLHLGASGYYLKQLTRDKFNLTDKTSTNAAAQGEGKQQVVGIGPGAMWEAAKTDKLFANVVFPMKIEARWDHTFYQLRWIHSF